MVTIITGTVPAPQFALSHTFSTLPGVQVECERLAQSGTHTVIPLLWVRYADREAVEAAFAADPTVEAVSCLSECGGECLYRMEWVGHVDLLVQMLTNGEATVLDAYGQADRWKLRVLYLDRDHLSRTHAFASEHGLTFDIVAVRELEDEPAGRHGLTEKQYEALALAAERGYFDVPKRTILAELAAELDLSHQALSERLRRAMASLIEDALLVGAVPDEKDGTPRNSSVIH